MEKVVKKIDEQLQFWSAIGPFMTLLAVMVCLMKGTAAHTGFAVVGLAGIPLCLVWKNRGMLLSLALLAAVLVYQVPALAFDQQLWSAGIFVSFALSFLVTSLSFEESSHIVTGLVADSNSRLNQMQELDEKVKGIELELEDERNTWHAKFKTIEAEAVLYKEKFASTQTLVDAVQQELTTIYDKNKGLLEELFEVKSKVAVAVPPQELQALREKLHQEEERALTLELQLEEKEVVLQKDLEQAQKAVEEANHRASVLAGEKASITQQLVENKTSLAEQQQLVAEKELAFQQLVAEKESALQQLVAEKESALQQLMAEKESALQQLVQEMDRKSEESVNQFAALTQELQQLREEREALLKQKQEKPANTGAKKETAAYRKLQGMYKQLKEQFEEKCDILDETRRAQFHMQERLFNAQRELEEKQRGEKSEMETALEQHLFKMEEERKRLELEYAEEIESLNQIIASLSK